MKTSSLQLLATALLGLIAIAGPASAQFTGVTSVDPSRYSVTDRLTNLSIYGGYSVFNGQLHYWSGIGGSGTSYEIYDIAGGNQVSSTPVSGITLARNGYGDAFGNYDANSNTFYVGTYGDSAGGLYSYNRNTSTWSTLGSFSSLYAAAIYDGKVYASGLNAAWNGGTGQNNQIIVYNPANETLKTVIVATGNSAGVAVDLTGNVYYANYNGDQAPSLYMWTAEQVASVIDTEDLYLTYENGRLLTALPAGANGINVDQGGNVFVTVNDFGGIQGLLMWNESLGEGSGDNYNFIAAGDGFFGHIEIAGDFLNGGTLYVSSGIGIAEISLIPEPSSFAVLLGGALLSVTIIRRRR